MISICPYFFFSDVTINLFYTRFLVSYLSTNAVTKTTPTHQFLFLTQIKNSALSSVLCETDSLSVINLERNARSCQTLKTDLLKNGRLYFGCCFIFVSREMPLLKIIRFFSTIDLYVYGCRSVVRK